ncbi:hypothetical protein ACP4OV_026856 [Aristida adscensionis]
MAMGSATATGTGVAICGSPPPSPGPHVPHILRLVHLPLATRISPVSPCCKFSNPVATTEGRCAFSPLPAQEGRPAIAHQRSAVACCTAQGRRKERPHRRAQAEGGGSTRAAGKKFGMESGYIQGRVRAFTLETTQQHWRIDLSSVTGAPPGGRSAEAGASTPARAPVGAPAQSGRRGKIQIGTANQFPVRPNIGQDAHHTAAGKPTRQHCNKDAAAADDDDFVDPPTRRPPPQRASTSSGPAKSNKVNKTQKDGESRRVGTRKPPKGSAKFTRTYTPYFPYNTAEAGVLIEQIVSRPRKMEAQAAVVVFQDKLLKAMEYINLGNQMVADAQQELVTKLRCTLEKDLSEKKRQPGEDLPDRPTKKVNFVPSSIGLDHEADMHTKNRSMPRQHGDSTTDGIRSPETGGGIGVSAAACESSGPSSPFHKDVRNQLRDDIPHDVP